VGNYSLTATDTADGLAPLTSGSFAIAVGPVDHLAFTAQPGGGQDGAGLSTQPTVTIEDIGGNPVTTAAGPVTLTFASQPAGNTATLSCGGGTSIAAPGGVAAFAGCKIVGPVGNYSLTATDTADGLAPLTSGSFAIAVGPPDHLAFTTVPGGGPSGAVWAVQPAVTIEDIGGNTVTTSTDTVSLAITSGPSATFTCNGGPPSVAATAGVATFSGCQITGPPVFYTITASDPPLSSAASALVITP
jgi:hypothetical protein